ncbi:gastrula zinc finger protein XlCGF7.1-like [Ahaetulla prasina]|uniref:gastrula zinc finger protein XlCGF7.1-like n=1 Tax=Ahaetulla prasina TaxID=499056 RepID=UPI002647C603|nr:gastrula zinc finger protein XlCGF7.1-like [Ahaetulla prasina]
MEPGKLLDPLSETSSTPKKHGSPHECSECGKPFALQSLLLTHRKVHMGSGSSQGLKSERFFSEKDTKGLRSPPRLKPYKCDECDLCFAQKSHLLKHQKIHTRQKLYQCLECGNFFHKKVTLQKHEMIHTGEKPYKCWECGKSFSQKSGLWIHEKIHAGIRSYKCFECGYSFTRSSSLQNHWKTHTGEKNEKCLECGRCFSQKSSLVRHQKLHTGDKPHECPECEICFRYYSELQRHQMRHKGEKPYQCGVCGKRFVARREREGIIRESTQGRSHSSVGNVGNAFPKNITLEGIGGFTGERSHTAA